MEKLLNNKYARGSEWRKWDLHIHSPLSILNNRYPKLSNGEPDWDSFIQKLELLDHAVIGITDYFTIEGYKKLREYKESGKLKNIHTILPNIEFRLTSVLSSKKDGKDPRRLNFHVIFSDEVPVKDIEEHFLHDIDFFYEGNPQDKDDKRKLKISNLEDLGKKLISQHKQFQNTGLTPLEVGAMQAVVDHGDITKILNSGDRFKSKYLLIFPDQFYNLIDWDGQDHNIRKGTLQKSDMVFSSNPKTINWCLGREPYMEREENFIEEFKTLKPCIHGSDAHNINEIGHPCAFRGEQGHDCSVDVKSCELRYCWIKSDPTFEGLKQLLYEPAERVAIQQSDPTPIKSNYTLSMVGFTECKINDDLSLSKTDMELNANLVAVTGSRGSGKTALVDLIANCYIDRCNATDKNSFVRRIVGHDPNIETKLVFRNNQSFSKKINEQGFFEDSEIVYIAQGELERYIGDESDLDNYIRELVFENPQIKDSVKSFEFKNLTERIANIESKIGLKNTLISDLEIKTSSGKMQSVQLELKQKKAELTDIEKRISELSGSQSEEKIKIVNEKQNKLANLKTKRDGLLSLRSILRELIDFINNTTPEFNSKIDALNEILKKLDISEEYNMFSYTQESKLTERLSLVEREMTDIVLSIEQSQGELVSFETSIQEYAKLLDRKRELEAVMQIMIKKITDIETQKGSLDQAIQERSSLFKDLVETIILLKNKYNEIIEAFLAQKAEVLSDLDFLSQITFDSEKYLKTAEGIVDNRKITVINDEKSKSVFDDVIQLFYAIAKGDGSIIPKMISEVDKLAEQLRSKLKSSHTGSAKDFYNFLYGNYMDVAPIVRYKKTDLNKLSLGQKATVLIKIYLAQGDKPIIIDSHDDHLDNEFIMEELVKAIRRAKEYRQVILASNNGNVVINSDAEQVIVANMKDGKIAYISGSVENPYIREQALKVLEGGSEAFKKRQQKYRLGL
jgi:energy-coupling factor transporter ATP-binding protein EcfA2